MRTKLKPLAAVALLAIATTSLYASAASPRANQADLIQGMGERIPTGAKNVSLSPLFKVYTFDKHGLTFVQVNSLKDEVITVLTLAPGAVSRLPIGSAAEEPLVIVNDEQNQPLGAVTASASCPCSATVVFENATSIVLVIYGSNGEYISTVVLDKVKTPGTKPPA